MRTIKLIEKYLSAFEKANEMSKNEIEKLEKIIKLASDMKNKVEDLIQYTGILFQNADDYDDMFEFIKHRLKELSDIYKIVQEGEI